jgi:hypothetical protein
MALDGQTTRGPRLYPLGPDNGYFAAGVSADGRQILMAFFWTGLVALFFDASGAFIEEKVRPLPLEPPRHPRSGCYFYTPEFEAAVSGALQRWQAEIGFTARLIRVRRFSCNGLRIEDRPVHYEEFLSNRALWRPEELEPMRNEIEDWDRRGCFVLYWGNDLWLNGRGEVESS